MRLLYSEFLLSTNNICRVADNISAHNTTNIVRDCIADLAYYQAFIKEKN